MPQIANPWLAESTPRSAEKAAASSNMGVPPCDAAADRFVLDEVAFAEAIEPLPMFLSDAGWPTRTFLR